MPTLSSRRAPGTTSPSHLRLGQLPTLAIAVIIAGLVAAGCAQAPEQAADTSVVTSSAQCVQAVFDVLNGIIARPNDDQPFEDFVSRYGTSSATYAAYRDSFDPFYHEAMSHGIKAAENDVRTVVTKDCAGED